MYLTQPLLNDPMPSILIVDDNAVVLDLLAEGFSVFGFQVITAMDGVEAWNAFKRESVDIVLSDLYMPNLDGMALTRRIREQSPQTKIAVMTGGNDDEALQLLRDGVADYFFSKPFDLISACKSMLGAMQMA